MTSFIFVHVILKSYVELSDGYVKLGLDHHRFEFICAAGLLLGDIIAERKIATE